MITMRSDFIGNCTEFEGLTEAINEGQYLVPRMTREERRSAIAGPVAVGGAEITPRLVLRLLNDVGDDPDQLPILQHALMRTWDYWEATTPTASRSTSRHYEAIGTHDRGPLPARRGGLPRARDDRSRGASPRGCSRRSPTGARTRSGVREPDDASTRSARLAEASEAEAVAVVEASSAGRAAAS